MTVDEQKQRLRYATSAQHTRILAYVVAACVIAAGIYTDYFSHFLIALIPLALLVPWLQSRVRSWLRDQHPESISSSILMIDGVVAGLAVAAAGFSLVPSLTFVGILNASAMAFGSLPIWAMTGFMVLVGSLIGGAVFGFERLSYTDMPVEITVVSLIGFACYVGMSAYHLREQSRSLLQAKNKILEQQEHSIQVSRKLVKYLPTQVWESIFSGHRDARLQTHRKKLSVFFSDIKDFTETTDEMSPDALTEMLNTYFEHMSNIAIKYGGTIDKFIGDAILIFFGDPTTKGAKEDAIACVSMAIDMRRAMQVLRQKWKSMGVDRPLHIRMGITTGYCHVGNFGSETRMDYTIIGRDANLAARLQGAASPDEILIAHDTYLLVRDRIMCREKGTVTLKGFGKPVQVWEVVDFRADVGANSSWIEHEVDGFTMHVDINKIRNYDQERIVKALESAASVLRNRRIG